MFRTTLLTCTLVCVLSCASADARDAAAGKLKAAQLCSVCHGANGLSLQPNAPHLAGQPAIYAAEQLKAYRSGTRKNEVMAVIAKSLNDHDIDNLAAWFESIKISVDAPK